MSVSLTLLTVLWLASAPQGGLETMAAAGRWQQLLDAARLRQRQLPLRPDEALLAAAAAGRVGDGEGQRRFLAEVVGGGDLDQVARAELGLLVADGDPGEALDLVLPLLRRADTPQLAAAAVTVAVRALERGLPRARRTEVEKVRSMVPRSERRRLELALALCDGTQRERRLSRILQHSMADLPALDAARALLAGASTLSPRDRWRVAETLYRHAMYEEAIPLLEDLSSLGQGAVPAWEVAFTRGRCAFRRDRWPDAVAWYARAIPLAPGRESRAKLEVHLARALELAGDIEGATEAARRAVVLRSSDERRLFLARLRLRRGELDLARLGVSRVGGWSARERGQLLLALDELGRGEPGAAGRRLAAVRHRRWLALAAVLQARIAAAAGRWDEVVTVLEGAAWAMDPYWSLAARRVMAAMPAERLSGWREAWKEELAQAEGRSRRRVLRRAALLEVDPVSLEALRAEIGRESGLEGHGAEPTFATGLAARLWQLGLVDEAVRWDPRGLPRQDAAALAWTAGVHLAHGNAERAIRDGDTAWRMAGADLPLRGHPRSIQRLLHPLPEARLLVRTAAASDVPWALVAAVVREESRWDAGAVSSVGARGLMQLMPSTAAAVAGRLGQGPPSAADLFRPAVALRLGAAELGRLLAVFDGRAAAAVAAYNAGEAQARQWLESCGPDCDEGRYLATITFSATRGYTASVLAAAATYEELYPALSAQGGETAPGSAPGVP
jgi:soluble lytic murein transglycosylase-like protein